MSLAAVILIVLKISIMLSVFAVGLHATMDDATSLFRHPADLVRAFLSMNVVMLLFALALVAIFDLHPAVKIALVALSVSPVPPFLPGKALKQGGRENYTIGLLVAMALLAILVVPISMAILHALFAIPLQMTARSVTVLALRTTVAPVLTGIVIRHLAPSFAERVAKPVGTFASVLLVVSLLPVLFMSAHTFVSLIGNGTILALAAFAVVGLIVGYTFAGYEPAKRRVLAMATSSRHPGIAVAIAHANFPQQKLAVPAIALYLMISTIVTTIAAKRSAKAKMPAETETGRAA